MPPSPPKANLTSRLRLVLWQLQHCLIAAQVVLEFPEAFWASDFDYFGAAVDGGPELRGRCFMFWNCHRFCGVPILTSIISGGILASKFIKIHYFLLWICCCSCSLLLHRHLQWFSHFRLNCCVISRDWRCFLLRCDSHMHFCGW